MKRSRWSSFASVVVSVIISESSKFTVAELPDWSRWFWLLWSLLPEMAMRAGKAPGRVVVGVASVWMILQADWLAGWGVILSPVLPQGIAAG